MPRKSGRIAILREFFKDELKKRNLKPYNVAASEAPPKIDGGSLHRFLKDAPREQTSFNFIADLLQRLELPFSVLDTLNLNRRSNGKSI